ncbi:MAG: preprotein translocase subunit SecG [Clostridiales bacterium]|jgi:preprotein translocase subunit SecG|nr:preprotein translocase subunit SecG [Clostridiales bacterium]
MSGLEIAFGIVLLVFAVGIIAIVLLQEGQQKNNSVITGGSSDTFLSKHQGRSIDAFLARWTRFIAIGFFIFVIVVNIILFFSPNHANAGNDGNTSSTPVSSQVSGTESTPATTSGATESDAEAGSSAVSSGTESVASSSAPAESGAASSSTPESAANASSESAGSTVSSNA